LNAMMIAPLSDSECRFFAGKVCREWGASLRAHDVPIENLTAVL